MDLPRLEVMNAYWKKHPPLHLMVQAFLGIGEKTTSQESGEDQPDLATVLAQFPQAGAL
jgi:hypothetical protein